MGRIRRPRKPRYQPTVIQAWRKFRGISQEKLAERVGMTAASISRLENGEQPYNQQTLEALAAELDCAPADLISRLPGEPQDEAERLVSRLKGVQKEQATQILRVLMAGTKRA